MKASLSASSARSLGRWRTRCPSTRNRSRSIERSARLRSGGRASLRKTWSPTMRRTMACSSASLGRASSSSTRTACRSTTPWSSTGTTVARCDSAARCTTATGATSRATRSRSSSAPPAPPATISSASGPTAVQSSWRRSSSCVASTHSWSPSSNRWVTKFIDRLIQHPLRRRTTSMWLSRSSSSSNPRSSNNSQARKWRWSSESSSTQRPRMLCSLPLRRCRRCKAPLLNLRLRTTATLS